MNDIDKYLIKNTRPKELTGRKTVVLTQELERSLDELKLFHGFDIQVFLRDAIAEKISKLSLPGLTKLEFENSQAEEIELASERDFDSLNLPSGIKRDN